MTIQCEYCEKSASSIRALTGTPCTRHPLGSCKGNHKLYEGSEKPIYTCKYCGRTEKSIAILTNSTCGRHPSGFAKGKHAPSL
ncbi:hypothetical protein [Amniculibacterium sp. G2-70]|uniref:hypothetical protein n=1 Tax=Amniculibacterium sp. G2-70 TaxID=2767188 RepID=UPI00165485FC|nr:hypothetical protein [Amniculibacterium sp. G2-70]